MTILKFLFASNSKSEIVYILQISKDLLTSSSGKIKHTERCIGSICLVILMQLISQQRVGVFNLKFTLHFWQDMLQTILPVLEQLLNKCEDSSASLNEDESILLQLIVQKYSPATVALLQTDSACWKLLLRVLSLRTSVCPGHSVPIMTALGQVRKLRKYNSDKPTIGNLVYEGPNTFVNQLGFLHSYRNLRAC